jgi:hypothetical protein
MMLGTDLIYPGIYERLGGNRRFNGAPSENGSGGKFVGWVARASRAIERSRVRCDRIWRSAKVAMAEGCEGFER